MVDEAALVAARIRSSGALAGSTTDRDTWQLVHQRLASHGRRLVHHRDEVAIGYADTHSPPGADDERVEIPVPSDKPLVVFGAVLRACWTDPMGDPDLESLVAIDALIAGMGHDPEQVGGARSKDIWALRWLHEARLIDLDEDAGTVRLGIAVAGWNAIQIESFRRIYAQLPQGTPTDPDGREWS